jgi:hypothetical protein
MEQAEHDLEDAFALLDVDLLLGVPPPHPIPPALTRGVARAH